MKLARLDWTGPFSLEEVLQLTGKDDYGIYQVSGSHVVFGRDSLLYIGRAVGVTFGARFQQHASWVMQESGVEIRLARPRKGDYAEDDDWKEWDGLARDCEALNIYWHSPPYNSRGLNAYKGNPLRIQNCGERGSVLPEVSSDWKKVERPEDG